MSFRLKTILGIALIEAVLLFILVSTGLGYITSSAQDEFIQRASTIIKMATVSSKNAAISSDLASLDSFAHDMLDYPGVLYIRILDTERRTLATAGQNSLLVRDFKMDNDFETIEDGVMDISGAIEESGANFGFIEIGISVEGLKNVITEAKQFGGGIALLEMILVGLFSFILGTYLTRQLSKLTTASEHIIAGEYGYQIAISGRDEIAQTAMVFNDMSSNIQQSHNDLSQREVYWRQVVNSTGDGILVIDETGTVETFSAGAEAMLGYDKDEVIGRNVKMLVPSPHHEQHDRYIRDFIETSESKIIGKPRELEAVHKDGSKIPIKLYVSEVKGMSRILFIGVLHDISESKIYESQLQSSLLQKESLLKEIHHRVKNNLVVVISLLDMQKDVISDPALKQILDQCKSRVHSMALIHEKLYLSPNLSTVDIADYLEDLIRHLTNTYSESNSKIEIHTELVHGEINIETTTPLGLIVNELISNCFKHAFAKGASGDIWVSLTCDENSVYCLGIGNNGNRLPENFSINNTGSIGMLLVDLLSSQLDAKLEVQRDPHTKFQLSFAELNYQNRL